jgi:hypothetical protein
VLAEFIEIRRRSARLEIFGRCNESPARALQYAASCAFVQQRFGTKREIDSAHKQVEICIVDDELQTDTRIVCKKFRDP